MCYRPFFLKKYGTMVPCNKCPKCIARRTSAWSFRLMQEEKQSSSAHFITLTYDTKYIPISQNGLFSLNKRDVQLFYKRLRKAHVGRVVQTNSKIQPLKYYTVGEYGGRTKRPHYHIILFNAELELIQPAWKMGHIYYGEVSGASVGYTLKYMCKPKWNKKKDIHYGVQPEFALMSKGLGISYLNETMANWHVADLLNRMYCTAEGGVKLAMPRYYKEKLYFQMEKSAIAEAYQIINNEKEIKKLSKQTFMDVQNEQRAIDASFDRMYRSSLKTVI